MADVSQVNRAHLLGADKAGSGLPEIKMEYVYLTAGFAITAGVLYIIKKRRKGKRRK